MAASLVYRRPMIRVCVAGVTGWTGRAVAAAVEAASDLQLVAGVSRSDPESYSSVAEALDAVGADVLVDYTHAAAIGANVQLLRLRVIWRPGR